MLTCCTCGCAPTVCWTRGFVGFLPVLRPPACSGSASSGVFSSHIWFTPFAMGSPLRGRGYFVLDQNEGLVCFPFPFGLFLHVVPALRDEVTMWVRCWLGAPAASRGCCALSTYGWASNFCLRLLFAPCPTGVFPGGPRSGRESSVVLSSLQCSSLSHVMVTCSPPRPLLRV